MLANDFDVPRKQVKSWTPKAGGAACNVAAGLAKFGVPISIISAVGRDKLGDDLIATLQSTQILSFGRSGWHVLSVKVLV